ncbi:MAG: hypothetical protein RL141_167 [Candidatus Parcubacteria bacterium]
MERDFNGGIPVFEVYVEFWKNIWRESPGVAHLIASTIVMLAISRPADEDNGGEREVGFWEEDVHRKG